MSVSHQQLMEESVPCARRGCNRLFRALGASPSFGHRDLRRRGRHLEKREKVSMGIGHDRKGTVLLERKGIPVPQESILEIRPLYSGFLAIDWKTPSAIVERQMLPRQTKRTEIDSDILAGGYDV